MAQYTNSEMTDMVLMYGRSLGNAREAQRLYHEAFPERRLPDHRTFASNVQRLRENGKFYPRSIDRGRERTDRILDAEPRGVDIGFRGEPVRPTTIQV